MQVQRCRLRWDAAPDIAPVAGMIDLTGRRAFVTGGARGIGAAVARRLVEAGATVTVGDIAPGIDASAAAMGAHAGER